MPTTTLAEAILITDILALFDERFKKGARPISVNFIAGHFNVSVLPVQRGVRFLIKNGILIESAHTPHDHESTYVLARDLKNIDQTELLQAYLHIPELTQTFDARPVLKDVLSDLVQSDSKIK